MDKWEAAICRLLLTWCLASSLLFIHGGHTIIIIFVFLLLLLLLLLLLNYPITVY